MVSAEVWFERGVAHEKASCPQEALAAYRKALAARKDFAEAWFNLGTILWECGVFEDAGDAYAEAVRYRPRLAEAWYNWGLLLIETGNIEAAIRCLASAVEIDPAYADAHFNLAQSYEWAGREQDAHRHWRAYLQLDYDGHWAAIARRHLSEL